MKVTCILGSPIRQGNSENMAQALLRGLAEQTTVETETFVLNEMNFRGCQACNGCKETPISPCVEQDDMLQVHKSIRKTDLLLIASPLYMDSITAQAKGFADRLNAFIGEDFSPRLSGIHTFCLYSQGLEDEGAYSDYFDVIENVYRKFGLDVLDRIVLADAGPHDRALRDEQIMSQLQETGRRLAAGSKRE